MCSFSVHVVYDIDYLQIGQLVILISLVVRKWGERILCRCERVIMMLKSTMGLEVLY